MTLLQDIQEAATEPDIPVSTLLRKAQLLAARMKHEPLRAWAVAELNGYDDRADLPDYRKLGLVPVLGDFGGVMGSGMKNAPLPPSNVPEEIRESLFTHDVYEGAAALEAIVRSGPAARYPWPANVVVILAEDFYEHMALMQANKVVSSTALAGVLDTIRTRLLTFTIEIEQLDSHAGGPSPSATPDVSPATVSQVFHTSITGGAVTIAAAGQGDVSQQVQTQIDTAQTWDDVSGTLREWGLPEEDIVDLGDAIARDRESTDAGTDVVVVGDRTRSWIGGLAGKIATGTVQLAKNVSTDVITALLTKAAGG